MSRLVLKRFPGESVVIDRDVRLTVMCIRGDGPRDVAVALRLDQMRGGVLSSVTFGLDVGRNVPVGAHTTVELQRAYGGRCWLPFEGPRAVVTLRGELVTEGPWAVVAIAAARAGGAL